MIIYPSGVYTFNGQIQEEDMQMFWVYSYKGFSRTAARTVRTVDSLLYLLGISSFHPVSILPYTSF